MVRVRKSTITIFVVVILFAFLLGKVCYYGISTGIEFRDEIQLLKSKNDSLNKQVLLLKFKADSLNNTVAYQNKVISNYDKKFEIGKSQWCELKKELALKDSAINTYLNTIQK